MSLFPFVTISSFPSVLSSWPEKTLSLEIHLPFPAFLLPLSPLSTSGLQSPMPDQRGASMTCSCVYCQHRPVLGQLGEYEKARQ